MRDSSVAVHTPVARFVKRTRPCPSVMPLTVVILDARVMFHPGMPTSWAKPIRPPASSFTTSRQGCASSFIRTSAQRVPTPVNVTLKEAGVKGCQPPGTSSSTVYVPPGSLSNLKTPLASAALVCGAPPSGVMRTVQPAPCGWWYVSMM